MASLYKTICFVLISFVFFNCQHSQNPSSNGGDLDIQLGIEVYDSIVIENNSIQVLLDVKGDDCLFYDFFENAAIIVDTKDKENKIVKIAPHISGKINTGAFRGGALLSKGRFLLVGLYDFVIFDYNGKVLESQELEGEFTIGNLANAFALNIDENNSQTQVYCTGGFPLGDPLTPQAYDNNTQKNVCVSNLSDNTKKLGVPYPTDSPHHKAYYYHSEPMIALSETKLYVLFPVEDKLRVYDSNTLLSTTEIKTQPKYFEKSKGISFSSDKIKSEEIIKEDFWQQSRYTKMFANKEQIILQYQKGVPLGSTQAADTPYHQQYLQFFQKDSKLSRDIPLPKQYSSILEFESFDKIILVKNKQGKETSSDVYYLARVLVE